MEILGTVACEHNGWKMQKVTNLIRRRPVGVKWRLRCQNRCESASIQAGIRWGLDLLRVWYSLAELFRRRNGGEKRWLNLRRSISVSSPILFAATFPTTTLLTSAHAEDVPGPRVSGQPAGLQAGAR